MEGLEAGDERRGHQRGRELKCQEQGRGGHRASGLIEDEHRQRDLSQPITQLVDEAGQGQAAEGRQAKGAKGGGHRATLNAVLVSFRRVR